MAIDKSKRTGLVDITNMKLGIIEVAKESEREMTAEKIDLESRFRQLHNNENCMVIKAEVTKAEQR